MTHLSILSPHPFLCSLKLQLPPSLPGRGRGWVFFGWVFLFLLVNCDTVAAQTRPVSHAILFGLGATRQQDTYLSPLQYKGTQIQFLYETLRPTRLLKKHVSSQAILQADFSYTHSPAENADYLGAAIHYDHAWHYNWQLHSFRVMAGPQIGAMLGGLYNTRNGNNPAQARASIRISASVAALYNFRIWKQPFTLREQLDMPLVGISFSPAYGQSYYELFSLHHYDHNIRPTTPFNAPSLRSLLTLDIPFRRSTLRAAYLFHVQQSRLNHIRQHTYTHAFLIGYVRHLNIVHPRRSTPEGFVL